MKCSECGGEYISRTDCYDYPDPIVGTITIYGQPFFRCDSCGDSLLSEAMAHAIETERHNRISEFINNKPVKAFITAAEAATILGVTRQAFHKNHRIKRGFIYQTKLGYSTVYLKESVLKYKENGDGRFPLHREIVSNVV